MRPTAIIYILFTIVDASLLGLIPTIERKRPELHVTDWFALIPFVFFIAGTALYVTVVRDRLEESFEEDDSTQPDQTSTKREDMTDRMVDTFQVGAFIASGGFGDVYFVDDAVGRTGPRFSWPGRTKRKVFKLLQYRYLPGGERAPYYDGASRSFQRESDALTAIRKKRTAVGRITDQLPKFYKFGMYHEKQGNTDVKRPYLVMEHLSGQSLQRLLRVRAHATGSPRPLATRDTLTIALRICEALDAVHSSGYCHLDLKPDNILIWTKDSRIKRVMLVDFGTAAPLTGDKVRHEDLYRATSWPYASPEYVTESSVAVTRRSDLYSLGWILQDMVIGQPAADIKDPGAGALSQLPADTPPELRQLIDSLRRLDPETRPASVAVVARSLERMLAAERRKGGTYGTVDASLAAAAGEAEQAGFFRRGGGWDTTLAVFALLATALLVVANATIMLGTSMPESPLGFQCQAGTGGNDLLVYEILSLYLILFCPLLAMWQGRAQSNLRALGAINPRPVWGIILSYLVPIVVLILPPMNMFQLWSLSGPRPDQLSDTESASRQPVTGAVFAVTAWWATYIIGEFTFLTSAGEAASDGAGAFQMTAFFMLFCSSILLFGLILSVYLRQRAHFNLKND